MVVGYIAGRIIRNFYQALVFSLKLNEILFHTFYNISVLFELFWDFNFKYFQRVNILDI